MTAVRHHSFSPEGCDCAAVLVAVALLDASVLEGAVLEVIGVVTSEVLGSFRYMHVHRNVPSLHVVVGATVRESCKRLQCIHSYCLLTFCGVS